MEKDRQDNLLSMFNILSVFNKYYDFLNRFFFNEIVCYNAYFDLYNIIH